MKAKQFFYAMGQQAKSLGVNKHRALRTYHLGAAPPYAKHAFIAGWEAQEATQVIEYRYEELDDKAKSVVYERYFAQDDHDYADIRQGAAEAGEALWHVEVDRERADRRRGADLDFECDSYDRVTRVRWEGVVRLREAALYAWRERSELPLLEALFEGGMLPSHLPKTHNYGMEDVALVASDDGCFPEGTVCAGANMYEVVDALGGDDLLDELQRCAEDASQQFEYAVAEYVEQELAYIQSEEYVQAMCDANEYRFDESGALL